MRFLLIVLLVGIFLSSYSHAEIKMEAPPTSSAGSDIEIQISGANPKAFVTVVAKGAEEGKYNAYQYVREGKDIRLTTPPQAGEFELRLLSASSPYSTLISQPLTLIEATASFSAPTQIDAGSELSFTWEGPNNARDYIAIGNTEREYLNYHYTKRGSPMSLRAPETPGAYELRYFLGSGDTIIARHSFEVKPAQAVTFTAPAQIAAGAQISIDWQGPNNAQDFITIVEANAKAGAYGRYAYAHKGGPIKLLVPETPGLYEIRYLSGRQYLTLGTATLEITGVSANLSAADEAPANSQIEVHWQGPGNPQDYITIVAKDASEGSWNHYTYANKGSPILLRAPMQAGDYELRYSAGQSYKALARRDIRITPAAELPGRLQVKSKPSELHHAVEIILDASGSMLQRLDGGRRIEIARKRLESLVNETIPANTPFALRVFGKEVDSCQSDLEIPLSPLNAKAVSAKLSGIEAKNGAKTAIADSLAALRQDLASVSGEKLVIVLTDGEETCDGDPAATIAALKEEGFDLRVNIIGFAIDDSTLEAKFAHWAQAGSGLYFPAGNAEQLNQSLQSALVSAYEIRNAEGELIREGLADEGVVELLPGRYQLKRKGSGHQAQEFTIVSNGDLVLSL